MLVTAPLHVGQARLVADHASCDAPAVKPIKRTDGKSERQAAEEKAVCRPTEHRSGRAEGNNPNEHVPHPTPPSPAPVQEQEKQERSAADTEARAQHLLQGSVQELADARAWPADPMARRKL